MLRIVSKFVHLQSVRHSSFFNLSKGITMDKDKCYIRLIENEDRVDITFLFKIKEDNIRQFNFSRRPSETLEILVARIGNNIQRIRNKPNKKKKNTEQDTPVAVNLYDSINNVIDNTSTCIELFSHKGPIKLHILDSVYEVVFNPPWVLNLSLPNCILAGYPIYPENLLTQNSKMEFNKFEWFRGLSVNEKGNQISDCHIKWEQVHTEYIYTPSMSDIGMQLKLDCIPGNENMKGPKVEVKSISLVEAGPGSCPYETRQMFTQQRLKFMSFRVVTYNILADLYCDSDYTRTVLHPYCPAYALQSDYRKHLIMKELRGYNADILCLQEVDAKVFNHCLQPILNMDGFEGQFYKKGKSVAEGLACFYRADRFRFLSHDHIVLSEVIKKFDCFNTIWEKVKDNAPLLERLLDRSTVSSYTILQSIENPDQVLVVGNTHLYFHPDADHIRLIQGGMFIYWLNDILNKTKSKMPDKKVSLILCGDFNSVPSCGIYQLYTTGFAPSNLPDWLSNENEAVKDLSLHQDVRLESACGTPKYTNFTAEFADCLDYIYFDKQKLKVEQVVPLPSEEELRRHTALPSVVFPSDHIALVADLCFID